MFDDPYRLPAGVTPTHYDMAIAPDLDTFSFEGTTAINVHIAQPTSQVVLNAVDLDLHSAVLVDGEGGEHTGALSVDPARERAAVTFAEPLAPGDAVLTIAYTGTINDGLRGFYRSTFTGKDGVEQVIAATQFESTDARRAFPCWDEPEYKATFRVSLLVPDGLLGLSNTAVAAERRADEGTWVTFEKTMKMSTYLVAFIVGPLVTTRPMDVDGVPLRVACVPGRKHLADFALEVGAHALRFLSGYFDIGYPAGKLDLVALPDFAFGAMENVGCVTFRETALLVDRDNAGRLELEQVAEVVAHEIAHMWFGNLVTMRWWNGIWLNEAFATFMEVATVDAFRPEWQRWVSFSTDRSLAMTTDALASTRPVEYEVVSPDDAEGMFDVLTYQKGGAVLRMLETYLGASRFRDGIRLYLDRHRYANTETTDLWDAVEEATGEPVRSIMDSWIFQGGYPVVSVEGDNGGVTLSQRRFRFVPSDDDAGTRWEVPILVRDGAGADDRLLLSDASTHLAGHEPGPLVVNAGGWGFFRTAYSPPLFAQVCAVFSSLDPIERYNLVSDTWANVLAGHTAVEGFLDLVTVLGDERNPSVWQAAIDGLNVIYREVPDARRDAFCGWLRSLAGPVFASLGWDPTPGEDDGVAKLRGLLLGTLGTIGEDGDVQARARDTHIRLMSGQGTASPDLLGAIVSTLAWNGRKEDYGLFWDRIRSATTPQEEVRYLFRLASFPDEDLIYRTLDATTSEIRAQNGAFVIAGALANRRAGRKAWGWLMEHWDEVLKRIPANSHRRMLEGVVRLTDPDSLREVTAFLTEHPPPSARRQVEQLLERQLVNAAFAERERPALAARFAN